MAFVTARLNAALDAALDDADFIRVHDGDPGAAGTANAVAAGALSGAGGATGGSDTLTATVSVVGPTDPVGYFSLWAGDPDDDGVCIASGDDQTLTPAEAFVGTGTLNITVTATAS